MYTFDMEEIFCDWVCCIFVPHDCPSLIHFGFAFGSAKRFSQSLFIRIFFYLCFDYDTHSFLLFLEAWPY